MKLTAQQKREFDKLMGLDTVYTQQGYQQQNEKHRQYDVAEANRQRGFSTQPRNQSEDRLQKAVEMTLLEGRQKQLDRKAAAPTLPEPAPVQLPKLSDIQSMQQWQTAYGSLDAYNKYAKENGWETATGTQIEEKLRQLNGVGSEQAVQQPEDLTHKPFGDEAEAIAQGRDRVGYLQKQAMEFDGRQKALQEASMLVEENLNQQKSNFDSEANQIEDQESLWFLRLAQDDPIAQTYDSYFDYMEAVRNGTVQQKYLPPDIQEHLDTYTRYVEKSDNLASLEKAYSNIQQELSLSEDLREIYSLSPDDMDAFIKVYDAQATNSGGAGPEWQRMMELFGYDKWRKLTSSYSQYMGLLKEQHRQAQKEKDMRDPVNVVLSNLYAPGLNLVSSIYTPIASIGQMTTNNPVYAEDERYGIKTNTGIYDMQRDIQDTRSGTRKLIEGEDPNAGRKFAGMLYGGLSSAVDNAARIGAGVVTGINPLGIMAVGSFSSSYEDAANRGANGLQAILYATASAALEVATEKIPLERLLSGTDADTVGKIIADILVKQPGLEIVGEEASYFGGMIADALIMGDKSENNQKLAAYMMAGYTKEQAQQLLTKDILYGAAQIAAETYISSAAMTGASYIGGAKQNGQAEAKAQDDGLNQILQQAADTPASQTVEAVKQASQQAQQQEAVTQNTQQQVQESNPVIQPQQNQTTQEQQAVEAAKPVNRPMDEGANQQNPPVRPVQQEPAAKPVEAVPIQKQQEQKSPIDIAMEATVRGEDLQPVRSQEAASVDPSIYEEYAVPEQTESVGAAPYGFDPYSRLQFETGNQRGRDWASRPVDVPKRDTNGNKVSEVVGNLYGSAVTPDRFIPIIQKAVTEGLMGAQKKTMEESVNIANQEIDKRGVAGTLRYINSVVAKGKISDNDIATAAVLYAKLANSGRKEHTDMASELFVDLGEMGRNAGRQLNLFRLFQMMTPEGQLLATKRNVEREVARVNKNRGDKKQASVEIPPQLELDLLEANREAASHEMAISAAAAREVAAVVGGEVQEAAKTAYDLILNQELPDLSGSGIVNEPPLVENLDAYNPSSTPRRGAREAANLAGFRMDNRSSASQSVRRAVTDVLTENYANKEAAARQIANIAVASMGLEGNAAEQLAQNIVNAFYADLAERSAARIEQMFGERNMQERTRRTLEQRLEELYNLGAFSNEQYRQVAFDSLFGEGSGIDIPDSLMQEYVDAAEERRGEALHAIYAYAAANMPATFSEKWNAWRHMSMLGNLLTVSRNTLSTLAFRPYVQAKRVVGAAMENVVGIEQSQRTKSVLVGKRARDLLRWASQDAMSEGATRQLESLTQTENEARSEIQELRRIFKNNALETLRRGVSTAMQGRDTGRSTTSILKGTSLYGDLILKRAEYRTALASFMKARGYTAQQLQSGQVSEDVLSEGRSYAISEAMKATFNDLNQVSKLAAKRPGTDNFAGKFANFMLEGILPYRKTPANIAVRAVENSPANLVRGIYNAATKVRNGEMNATQAIDQISSGFVGTSAMALGAALAAMGILVGGWPDEEDQRNGFQPYSLRIGNKTYTIDFLAPANLPLFMGANLQHSLSGEDGGSVVSTLTAVLDAGMNTLEPMLELSMLSSLNDLLESAKYADEGREVYSLLAQSATSYFLQGLPTIFGNFDRAADENRKIVYANSDDPVIRELERLGGKVFQKLPGDFFQTEYVDEFGEFQYKGNAAVRILNSLANPFYVREIRDDEVTRELDRLEKETGEKTAPTSAPRSFSYKDENGKTQEARLTGNQWTQFQKTKGELELSILSGIFGSDAYNQLSDNGKYKAVEMAGDYAMAYAKNQLVPEYKLEQWMKETGADPGKILERAIIAESGLSEARYETAKEMGYSLDQMSAISSQVSDYLSGMDDKTDYDTYRAVLSATQGEERDKWLEVYGLSGSRMEAMQEARKRGYSDEQCIDAFEVSSLFASAQSATSKAWSDGKELPTDKWEEAYNAYQNAPDKLQRLISSQLSTKFTAYLELRNAGMDTKTFLLEVKKYSDIGEEDGDLNDATRWHKALDDDVASRLITSTQRNILLQNMRYFVQIPQNADKYEELKKSGLDPDSAEYIMAITEGLLPEYGKKTVTDLQIWESIISSDLAGPEKTSALEGYMDEKQEQKLAYAVSLGFSPSEYVDMYRVYKDTAEYGKGRKEFRIQEFMNELGIDRDLAEALLEIYDGVYGK